MNLKEKFLSYALLGLLLVGLIPVGLHIASENVSAVDTHTWKQTSGNLASTAANWDIASTPTAGDAIIFDATSTAACTWDIAGDPSFGAFTIAAGYGTAIITQSSTFTIVSYTQASGTFLQGANVVVNGDTGISGGTLTGSTSYTWTTAGNFTSAAATLTDGVLKLIMTGTAKTLNLWAGVSIYGFTVSGSITATSAPGFLYQLNVSGTFTIATGVQINVRYIETFGTYSNTGVINGLGALAIVQRYGSSNIAFGVVNCPVILTNVAGTGSFSFTLTSPVAFGSTLAVSSAHATYTVTLDLSASNYALSANGITIGTRGIINGRASQITDSGNWDSSVGTFTKGTSSVHLTGASKTLKTNNNGFYNLMVESGASYTMQSNVTAYNYWGNGTLTKAGCTLFVNNDQAPVFTSSPSLSISYIDSYSYDANATDQEAEALTYGLSTDSPDLGVNTTTGVISGTAPLVDGTYYVDVSVTDGNHTTWQNYSLDVENADVTFSSTPPTTWSYAVAFSYDADATDPESQTIYYDVTTDYSGGMTVDHSTGVVSHIALMIPGTYYVHVSGTTDYGTGLAKTVWQNFVLTISPPAPASPSGPIIKMNVFTAWAFLQFVVIVTVALISVWRGILYVWDLFETGAEKVTDLIFRKRTVR